MWTVCPQVLGVQCLWNQTINPVVHRQLPHKSGIQLTCVCRHCHSQPWEEGMCLQVYVGWWWGWLLWVMAPVWQGLGKWSRSDQYVIMLTTIPPPIVLPETNLLKIHPIPSSPTTANNIQRERKWKKMQKEEVKRNEYQNKKQFSKLLYRIVVHVVSENVHSPFNDKLFFFISFFFAMHLLVIFFGRFAARWNASHSEVIPLLPHWLPINEGISTNTFWRLRNRFCRGLCMRILTNTHIATVFKSNPSEDKRGFCSQWLHFTSQGQ